MNRKGIMRQGTGKFINREIKTKDKLYPKFFIYVPVKVAQDTSFPFHEGDSLDICVDGEKLIIRKKEKGD